MIRQSQPRCTTAGFVLVTGNIRYWISTTADSVPHEKRPCPRCGDAAKRDGCLVCGGCGWFWEEAQ